MVQQGLFAEVLHTDTLSIKDHHHRIHFTPLRFSGPCEMDIICGKMLLHAHATTMNQSRQQTKHSTQNTTSEIEIVSLTSKIHFTTTLARLERL